MHVQAENSSIYLFCFQFKKFENHIHFSTSACVYSYVCIFCMFVPSWRKNPCFAILLEFFSHFISSVNHLGGHFCMQYNQQKSPLHAICECMPKPDSLYLPISLEPILSTAWIYSSSFHFPSLQKSWSCLIAVMPALDHLQFKLYITRSLFWDNFNPPVARISLSPFVNPCISWRPTAARKRLEDFKMLSETQRGCCHWTETTEAVCFCSLRRSKLMLFITTVKALLSFYFVDLLDCILFQDNAAYNKHELHKNTRISVGSGVKKEERVCWFLYFFCWE